MLTLTALASLLAAQGCAALDDPAAEARASASVAAAAAPTHCPRGFTSALGDAMKSVKTKPVAPESVGLPASLKHKIVCAVTQYDPTFGDSTVLVVMRADLSEDDVRHALWDARFDDRGSDASYVRDRPVHYGDVDAAFTQTYASLVHALGRSGSFARFIDTFPAMTQVATFTIKSKPIKQEKPDDLVVPWADGSGAKQGPWSCDWSPTMNNNWHDDVLCTDGTEQDRPYLLAGDSFITPDEIMRAASEYERSLNGG